MNARLHSLCLAALLPLVLSPIASAQAPTPGDRWRTTMSMEMGGMKMPGMSNEICAPRDAIPEPAPQEDCVISNRKRVGNTESFDMVCTGKNRMSGRMEMTQESPSRWRGKMMAKTDDGEMTMSYTGDKLPGECDASEMERKMNKLKAQGDAMLAKECASAAKPESLNPMLFVGAAAAAGSGCKDAASRKTYCESARTYRGYSGVASYQRLSASPMYKGAEAASYKAVLADTGKLCGFSPETVRTQLCGTAQGKKEWKYLAEECAEISKPLAQRECAGRDFTTPVSPPYVDFCSAYAAAGRGASLARPDAAGGNDAGSSGSASTANQGGQAGQAGNDPASGQPETPTDKAKDALNKGKQALKGLFGR